MSLNNPEKFDRSNLVKILIPRITKRYFRKWQNKLAKIVVVFVVTAAPCKCLAISFQFLFI